MRREQVHKICLNHALTADIEYKPKDDKSWQFAANDYTDGEVELLLFCLRFKNSDIANAFKTAATDALSGKLTTTAAATDAAGPADAAGGGATVGNVSDEDKRLAEQLKLPLSFFAYRNAPDCGGCRGCQPDEFVFPATDRSARAEYSVDDAPLPLTLVAGRAKPSASTVVLQQSSFSFVTPQKTPAPATAAAVVPAPAPAPMLFGSAASGGNLFGSQTTFSPAVGKSIFGDNSSSSSPAASTAAAAPANIFGAPFAGAATATAAVPTGASIFGGAANNKEAAATTPKPLPTKSFTFGSPFGGPSPFQLASITSTAPGTTTTPTSNVEAAAAGTEAKSASNSSSISSTFKFALPAATTITPVAPADTPAADATTPVASAAASTATTASGAAAVKPFSFHLGTTGSNNDPAPISIFGGAAIFKQTEKDGANAGGNIFGSASAVGASVFGSTASNADSGALPFKDSGITFASLATTKSPAKPADATSTGGFIGLSKKDDFSSFQRRGDEENGAVGDDSAAAGGEDANYDPHYEPIIALPDEIEVRTGEEEEEKVFGERAKLFRYDATNREWKERGECSSAVKATNNVVGY